MTTLTLQLLCAFTVGQTHMRLEQIPFSKVTIRDSFWAPRQMTNTNTTIAHSLQMLDKYGYVKNFELAAEGKREGFSGLIFMDSDLYKVIEAASYSLVTNPDKKLEGKLDKIIAKLAAAQMPDGYLNTYFQIKTPEKRFENLRDAHEIYCFGHLAEAAVAHYQATGKTNLLNVAKKFADLLAKTFGNRPGQRPGYCGHPESELALMKLWRVTGIQSYRDLAGYFLTTRGSHFFATEHDVPDAGYDGSYWQDDVPIQQHAKMKGHAVRAAYLMSGVTDYVSALPNKPLTDMLDRVWRNCMERNVYLTGGIGPSAHNEGFTIDYDLPNDTAYQETCASVAIVFWAHRMILLTGESKYADAMERALYNGALAGISLSGDRFYYVNPLSSEGSHHRTEWYSCACCPPNISRLIASLGSYVYAVSEDTVAVNLFVGGGFESSVAGAPFKLQMKTEYPWDGKATLTISEAAKKPIHLLLRKPDWCAKVELSINGKGQKASVNENGYIEVSRKFSPGDKIVYRLSMQPRWVEAHPAVKANRGHVAIERGPLVYCVEQVDNKVAINSIAADTSADLQFDAKSHTIVGGAFASGKNNSTSLYRPLTKSKHAKFVATPYYSWDNREPGPMRVWLPTQIPPLMIHGLEADAKLSMSHVSGNCQPEGIRDGREPQNSAETPASNCHFWPRKGTSDDWVQYEFTQPVQIDRTRIYWFDDTGRGECKVPKSYEIQVKSAGKWKPIELLDSTYALDKDRWIEIAFKLVKAEAIRLKLVMQPGWSTGIHEWQVFGP